MSIKTKVSIALSIVLLAIGTICLADVRVTRPFTISFEPSGPLLKGTPVTMSLEYSVNSNWGHLAGDTGSYSVIFLNPRDHEDTISITTYPVTYDTAFSHSTTFQATLPDADTTFCVIKVTCGTIYQRDYNYFISDGNRVEFLPNFRLPPPLEYQTRSSDSQYYSIDINRDTLTQEQMQARLDMAIDLRDSEHFRLAKEMLGGIPDTCLTRDLPGHYIINMTLEQAYMLYDMGIPLEGARGKYKKQTDDEIPEKPPDSGSKDTQGTTPPPPQNSTINA